MFFVSSVPASDSEEEDDDVRTSENLSTAIKEEQTDKENENEDVAWPVAKQRRLNST